MMTLYAILENLAKDSPQIVLLLIILMRTDARLQECFDKLCEHLDKHHSDDPD